MAVLAMLIHSGDTCISNIFVVASLAPVESYDLHTDLIYKALNENIGDHNHMV